MKSTGYSYSTASLEWLSLNHFIYSSSGISARVLTNEKRAAIIQEREEKKQKEQEEKRERSC